MSVYEQRIAAQLYHFYERYKEYEDPLSRYHSHLHLDLVFDHLKERNKEIVLEGDIKDKLWKMAIIECKEQHVSWMKALKDKRLAQTAKELLTAEKIRFFKTYITRYFLLEKLKDGIWVQVTDDETGKKVSLLSFVGK